ncbi:MAG: hypothetical protein Q4B48_00450 [Syntrophomonadaceae bacterium]|nr:hypothetical protein [Syntrophomonadaceae bacterium]
MAALGSAESGDIMLPGNNDALINPANLAMESGKNTVTGAAYSRDGIVWQASPVCAA